MTLRKSGEWRGGRLAVGAVKADDVVDAESPTSAVLVARLRDLDGLFPRVEAAGVERLDRFAFFALGPDETPFFVSEDAAVVVARMTGARTGEVSMREAMERFEVVAAWPGLPSVWSSLAAALRSRSIAVAPLWRSALPLDLLFFPAEAATFAAKTCDGADDPAAPVVRDLKAPIGMRLQREKSERAAPGLDEPAPPSVVAPFASVSDDVPFSSRISASTSTDSCRTESKSKPKSTLARTGEPILLPMSADSAPDVPDVLEKRESARMRREGVESSCERDR